MMKKEIIRKKIFPSLVMVTWIAVANSAPAFQSDYISVEAKGSGSDVILIPGFASSPEVWSGLAEEIGGEFRLHFIAVSGFAGTAPPKVLPESILMTLRDEVIRYIDEEELEKPKLIGHSMGGLTSLLIAGKETSKVDKVLVVDALPLYGLIFSPLATTAQMLPIAKTMEKQMEGLDDSQFKQRVGASASAFAKNDEKKMLLLKWSTECDRKTYLKYQSETMAYDAREELKAITCPVTVIYAHDEAERLSQEQAAHLFSTAYQNLKTVSIECIPKSSHFVMWDQPEDFYQKVREFLLPAFATQSSKSEGEEPASLD